MKKKKALRRALALCMALTMLLSLAPAAYASSTDDQEQLDNITVAPELSMTTNEDGSITIAPRGEEGEDEDEDEVSTPALLAASALLDAADGEKTPITPEETDEPEDPEETEETDDNDDNDNDDNDNDDNNDNNDNDDVLPTATLYPEEADSITVTLLDAPEDTTPTLAPLTDELAAVEEALARANAQAGETRAFSTVLAVDIGISGALYGPVTLKLASPLLEEAWTAYAANAASKADCVLFHLRQTEEGALEAERLSFDFDETEPALVFAAWDFSPFVFGVYEAEEEPTLSPLPLLTRGVLKANPGLLASPLLGAAPDPTEAFIDQPVPWFDPFSRTSYSHVDTLKISAGDASWGAAAYASWYAPKASVTLSNRVIIQGDVTLILPDGMTITAKKGIGLTSGSSLTVYGQSGRSGKLIATAEQYNAGIGGTNGANPGDISLNGGIVEATGGNCAAGIGGGHDSANDGVITINYGTVTAGVDSFSYGAGIGGGHNRSGGTIIINGGTVTATGGKTGAGIGGGGGNSAAGGPGGNITITGGTVIATGGSTSGHHGGAGIGGAGTNATDAAKVPGAGGVITITGGTVTAIGGGYGAGIGGGGGNATQAGAGGTITIGGDAQVIATGGASGGAGIGGGSASNATGGDGGTITIEDDAQVIATGGGTSGANGGAGIGGGGARRNNGKAGGNGGTVVISGNATVTATAGYASAGIGSGCSDVSGANGGTITIGGGTVTASSGGSCAAIGGGYLADGGTITITGGTVTATGDTNSIGTGAGIGGGYKGDGGDITITGGTVIAHAYSYSAAIGGGPSGSGGTITITGGEITATSNTNSTGNRPGTGIGGGGSESGTPGSAGNITITGGVINATSEIGAGIGGGNRSASGTLTLDWSDPSDPSNGLPEITASSYAVSTLQYSDSARPFAKKGAIRQVYSADAIKTLEGVTIVPGLLEAVPYLDDNGDAQQCTAYTLLSDALSATNHTLTDGWYVVDVDTAHSERIVVSGNVHLILVDGTTLDATAGGVSVNTGNSLTLYAQSENEATMGALNARAANASGNAGIGGNSGIVGGDITINGGEVTATGGTGNGRGAGIGGGKNNAGGTTTINGGVVSATGSYGAAGIGGGSQNGASGNITINGGKVTATGEVNATGIGGGWHGAVNTITITGGEVTAIGVGTGAGIGGGSGTEGSGASGGTAGSITITGGTIHATSGTETGHGGGIGGGGTTTSGTLTLDWAGDDPSCGEPRITASSYALASVVYTDISRPFVTTDAPNTFRSAAEIKDLTNTTIIPGRAAVPYLDWDGASLFENSCDTYTTLTAAYLTENSNTLSDGWYVVSGNLTAPARITCSGNVHLILVDGTTLNATAGGISVNAGNSLTIYAQTEDEATMGALNANGTSNSAGIGGDSGSAGGTITVDGGKITATGGNSGAGIGGGNNGSGGTITINGGKVTARSGSYCAGIGGGQRGAGGVITINGGVVIANSRDNESCGIGGGRQAGTNASTITITGGNVTATGGNSAAAIGGSNSCSGGDIIITGGTITATGGKGIGYGNNAIYGTLTLDWTAESYATASVTASSYSLRTVTFTKPWVLDSNRATLASWTNSTTNNMAGVKIVPGEGDGVMYLDYNETTREMEAKYREAGDYTKLTSGNTALTLGTADAETWYVVDGEVTRTGGLTCAGDVHLILKNGAVLKSTAANGITVTSGNSLTIYAQTEDASATGADAMGALIATGTDTSGAGIGGGTAGTITIDGGRITATGHGSADGGSGGAGIGGGKGNGGKTTINGGVVTASANGGCGAGIGAGGGNAHSGGTITINGGTVTATAYNSGGHAAGIGGGGARTTQGGAGGTITITGGTVSATGGGNGAGIGGGGNMNNTAIGAGGTITITGGTVTATACGKGAGIGGGGNNNNVGGGAGTITITGGTVNATSAGSKGIGGGGTNTTGSLTLGWSGDGSDGLPEITASSYGVATLEYSDPAQPFGKKGEPETIYSTALLKTLENTTIVPARYPAVPYLDEHGEEQQCTEYTLLSGALAAGDSLAPGWYVVDTDITHANRIVCGNGVHLILKNGTTLTAQKGIGVNDPNSLSIYQQPVGDGETMGALIATAADNQAGIGGDHTKSSGTITINGGTINASAWPTSGNGGGAGIGAGNNSAGNGTVIINNGVVTANGTSGGAGIGGAGARHDGSSSGGTITINGGTVNATGTGGGAGIGGGWRSAGGTITITGGMVTATGYGGAAAGIGGGDSGAAGTITITGGTVTATGGNTGAGIGGGGSSSGTLTLGWQGDDYNTGYPRITSSGYQISTLSYDTSAGVSESFRVEPTRAAPGEIIYSKDQLNGFTETTTIVPNPMDTDDVLYLDYVDGELVAKTRKAGEYTLLNAANIGENTTLGADDDEEHWYAVDGTLENVPRLSCVGDVHLILKDGCNLSGQGITVNDGVGSLTIYGQAEQTGTLNINTGSSTVTVTRNAAGIGGGGGDKASNGDITINGGVVTARSSGGAGIGAYTHGVSKNTITINHGTVTAYGGSYSAGIGAGNDVGHAGAIIINGGTVTATGRGGTGATDGGSAGIGTGGGTANRTAEDLGGTILITGGTVTATGVNTGAGIGGGGFGSGDRGFACAVTITGGTVTATGGASAVCDIGPGPNAAGGTVLLTGDYDTGFPKITAKKYGGDVSFGKAFVTTDATTTAVTPSQLTGGFGSAKTIYPKEVGDPVPYLDYVNSEMVERVCVGYVTLDQAYLNANTTLGAADTETWYVVDGTESAGVVAAASRLTCLGDVHLILKNDTTLNATNGGINVTKPNSLTIYQQPETDGQDVGVLNASATNWDAGIGGNGSNSTSGMSARAAGTITINGGTVTAKGNITNTNNKNSPGIGAGNNSDPGTVIINGGTVTSATHGGASAAIGGAGNTPGGVITITGGTVNATSPGNGAAIGGGGSGSTIPISSGTITISGGTVTATNTSSGPGIGGGYVAETSSVVSRADITITGGTVTATSAGGFGIGSGKPNGGGNVTITGGTVTATGASGRGGIGGNVNLTLDWSDTTSPENGLPRITSSGYRVASVSYQGGTDRPFAKVEAIGAALTTDEIKGFSTQTTIVPGYPAVPYLDWYDPSKSLTPAEPCTNYTRLSEALKDGYTLGETDGKEHWYVVDQDFTANERIECLGDVHLILKDGTTLSATKGISVNEGNSLTIYEQSEDETVRGKLTATGASSNAGIGGDVGRNGGTVTVNGGTVTASSTYGAGIGAGGTSSNQTTNNNDTGFTCGTVTINAGTVTATSGAGGAGIGGGVKGRGGNITINGGTVIARGTNGGAGIGGGGRNKTHFATGGTITINGGTVTASGRAEGAGIGGGWHGSGGTITITGGVVNADVSGGLAASIGGGGVDGSGGNITITGGKITAAAGASGYGGIGAGSNDASGTLTLGWTAESFDSTEITSNLYKLSSVVFDKPYVRKTDDTLAQWTNRNTNNMDGVTIIPGIDFTQDAVIREARWFKSFDSTAHTVDIPLDYAWTVELNAARIMELATLTGTTVNRLTAAFSANLPANTVLTLTVVKNDGTTAYYYAVLSEAAQRAELTNFASMSVRGRQFAPAADDVTYLIGADFGDANASAMTGVGVNLTLDAALSNGTVLRNKNISSGALTFSLHPTLGAISASGAAVTINSAPHDDVRLAGKTVYLVGSFSGGVDLSTASARYGAITGQWISKDIVIFPLGTYGSIATGSAAVTLSDCAPGEHPVSWKLCAGAVSAADTDSWNIRGNVVSNEASGTVGQSLALPSLAVTHKDNIPIKSDDRVYTSGKSVTFTVAANRGFTVLVQKSTALGTFQDVGTAASYEAATTQVTVQIPADPGSYRVIFSMDGASINDNVYYAFIVDPDAA